MQTEQNDQQAGVRFGAVTGAAVFAVVMAATLILSVTGPFNTYGLGSFLARLLYWGGLVSASVGVALGLKSIVGRFDFKTVFWRETLTIMLFCVVFTPFTGFWTELVFPAAVETRPSNGKLFTYMIGICTAISLFRYGTPYLLGFGAGKSETSDIGGSPRLIKRLPDGFDGEILRLSGDGHYVNVATTEGPFDIRIRLSDAVSEMQGVDGFCVHRSHWVARAAVTGDCKERGRSVLILSNGDTVPVGAKYKPQLEEAGIL